MRLNLKQILADRSLTAYALAQQLHVAPPQVYRWIHGDAFPTLTSVKRLCQVLDVKIEELITLEDPPGS